VPVPNYLVQLIAAVSVVGLWVKDWLTTMQSTAREVNPGGSKRCCVGSTLPVPHRVGPEHLAKAG
jgi:hypothetical protein